MTTQEAGSGHEIQELSEAQAITFLFPAAPDEVDEPNPIVCAFKWEGYTCTRTPHPGDPNHVAHVAMAIAIWHGGEAP